MTTNENLLHSSIGDWLAYLDQQGKSRLTVAAYRRGVCHFAYWCQQIWGESFEPMTVIPRDVRDWQLHQRTVEKAAPNTINLRLAALSGYFKWAVGDGIAQADPVAAAPYIRIQKCKPQGLSGRELRRLLRAVYREGNRRDIAIIEVLAGTGVRVGELLRLSVKDVHMSKRSGYLIVRQGKQGTYREIPLTNDVRRALDDYLETHSDKEENTAPLWAGSRGSLKHRSSILRLLNKYTLRAGLSAIGPHQLRHTFATQYLTANPHDLRGLASLLGHTDLNSVMIYTEPTLDDLTTRMERVATGVADDDIWKMEIA
jgi:site-specific recombinase XerD